MELISRKLMIFAVMAFCLTMFAGAASKNVADKPEWLIQLPESGDYIYAVGLQKAASWSLPESLLCRMQDLS